jgi:preprotein translocase subunit SecA
MRWLRLVRAVAAQERRVQKLDDRALRKASLDLRWRAKGGESLDRLLPEAFALVREAARRVLGERHYDVQVLGAIALHYRSVAEMQTGEGKTLVATMPMFLNALPGRGVHLVTVNDYLARRDAAWMGPVYNLLGLTVGCIQTDMRPPERRAAYECDITYGTAKELGFDFLRDRLAEAGGKGRQPSRLGPALGQPQRRASATVQRGHYFAIVDEADSILIDEARTPLIISAAAVSERERARLVAYRWAAKAVQQLEEPAHYTYEHDKKEAELTTEGRRSVRRIPTPQEMAAIGMEEIYEFAERALKAQLGFLRDRDYVVVGDEVIIVDEFTGRMMPGRKWRDGLHQAVEAKEQVQVTADTGQAARTTIQNYFLRYKKLAGMTGTASSSARELKRIYKLVVVSIPTNRPLRRKLHRDRVYCTEVHKMAAVVDEIRASYDKGRPVLVGTRSIEKSEMLSELLVQQNIPHTVLNAKQHEKEAEIVAQAGQRGAVTIATNMAGRGTDIKLGEGVAGLGGLYVIGTERHDSARVDRQLVGRSARQGDPGEGRFLLSLDDELLLAFGPERAQRLRRRYNARGGHHSAEAAIQTTMNGRGAVDHLRQLFRRAQRKTERKHYKDRRKLMRYEEQRTEMHQNMGLDPFLD